jgi:hypothetical protein
VKSRSFNQLRGENLDKSQLEDCDPIITVAELGKYKTVDGTELPGDAPANPCGLVAKSYFTDSYMVSKGLRTEPLTKDNNITINDTNIAWESDRLYKFKRLNLPNEEWKKHQWIDVTDGKKHSVLILYRAFHRVDENSRITKLQEVVRQN